ncbi:hypothetical protein D9619_004995 [Psilocybe cf. subviscida]|uniref:Extracellular mutant protein 11 C-terminal domain-containing protein n=1 Tax=Psilocybe cf. subviscida TaxID=2480587 RepID=A0A8H5BQS9_9AGAR|nr:hypothetical protein D9619_004995 [Psilocybe cf. subviscida]
MSARAPFFPPSAAGRPNSRPEFTPDPHNPLHSAEPNGPTLGPFSASGQNSGTPASTGRPPTAGLGGLQARRSSTVNGNGKPAPRTGTMRPGTADPHVLRFVKQASMQPLPIVAPSPQDPGPRISPLLNQSPTNGFKIPYSTELASDSGEKHTNNAHISTSEPTLKFQPASRQSGPQRIPVNQVNQFNPYQKDNSSGGLELNENGRVQNVANRQGSKRRREEDEYSDESFTPYGKRFKSHDEPDEHESFSSRGNSSPGSASASHRSAHDAATADKNRSDKNSANLRSPSQSPQDLAPYSSHGPSSRPGAFQELLGLDPDAFIKKHMDEYTKLSQRFSNCTIDEWIAAADEIAQDFTNILDRVKSHMDSKLKLYAKFHTTVESHHGVLNQRQAVLDSAGKRLVAQSGSALK